MKQKDLFKGVSYAVLGLGDSNYDKFAHMGKSFDKRIFELGGVRCLDLCCADEATGLEETVEGWKDRILPIIINIFAEPLVSASVASSSCFVKAELSSASSSPSLASSLAVIAASTSACSSSSVPFSSIENVQFEDIIDTFGIPHSLPVGVMGFEDVARWLNVLDVVSLSAPEESSMPRTKSCKDLDSEAAKLLMEATSEQKSSSYLSSTSISRHEGWVAENPYHAQIIFATWLTAGEPIIEGRAGGVEWGSSRRVLHMEVALGDAGVSYLPGDSIGICPPNPTYLVAAVTERLMEFSAPTGASPSITPDTLVSLVDGDMVTLEELLTFR